MQRHILGLRYDGRRAARGALAPSVSKQVVAGAQMLLGAHGHYYLEGRIPEKINDWSHGFQIEDLARSPAVWTAKFVIRLFPKGIWEDAQYRFGLFVWESYKAWTEGRAFEHPPLDRRQPLLSTFASDNDPVFDARAWGSEQRLRLYRRINDAMRLITAPNGTSSSHVEIFLDGHLIDRIGERLRMDELIEDALDMMRAKRRIQSEPLSGRHS